MKWALASDCEILLAEDRSPAVQIFQEHKPAVALVNLGLPPNPGNPNEGLGILSDILGTGSRTKIIIIIIITGQGERQFALQAIGEGAYDFLCKPVSIDELKIILLQRAFYVANLEKDFGPYSASSGLKHLRT